MILVKNQTILLIFIHLYELEGVGVDLSYCHSVRAVTVIPNWSTVRMKASDWPHFYPLRNTVTSMLRMSPDSNSRASGIPCAATLFT